MLFSFLHTSIYMCITEIVTNIHFVLVFVMTSPNGGSQQACYDLEGRLLSSTNGGGTYDKSHVRGRLWPLVVPYVSHYFKDVLTYDMCCSWSSNCAKYLEVRPTDDCFGYQPPTPGLYLWKTSQCHNNEVLIVYISPELITVR